MTEESRAGKSFLRWQPRHVVSSGISSRLASGRHTIVYRGCGRGGAKASFR